MSLWIRVQPPDNGDVYFWNLGLNETVWDEPVDLEVVWNAAVAYLIRRRGGHWNGIGFKHRRQ